MPPVSHFTDYPSGFQYRRPCWHGWDTLHRQLPDLLLESPEHGSWRVETEEQRFSVGPGDVLLMPPRVRHRLVAESPVDGMVSTWLHIHWEKNGCPLYFGNQPRHLKHPGLTRALLKYCRNAQEEDTGNQELARQISGLVLLEYLTGFLEFPETGDPRIRRVLQWIHENHPEAPSRSEMAKIAGLSETRFHDVFVRAVGEAPVSYVNRIRLDAAARQLIHSRKPLTELAEASGYASYEYFSRMFKKHTGMSPNQYRKQMSPFL